MVQEGDGFGKKRVKSLPTYKQKSYIQGHYDGCGVAFEIYHALECKKGGLITVRHNKIYDGVADRSSKYFTPTYVRDDPKIYTGRALWGGNDKLKKSSSKEEQDMNEDLLTIYLWTKGTDSIHDMRVVNTDTTSYWSPNP